MSSPSVVVTLVHGTVLLARWPWLARTARRLGTLWPSRARGEIEWHQEGSTFRRRLLRAMGDECCVTDFDWPGANTEWERLCYAGAKGDFSDAPAGPPDPKTLRAHIAKTKDTFPGAKQVLVAHSHGGNLCLAALRDRETRAAVHGLACLSTPFVNVRSRADSAVLVDFLYWAGLGVLGVALFGSIYVVSRLIPEPWEGPAWVAGFILSTLAWVVLSVRTEERRKAMRRWASTRRTAVGALPVLVLLADGDEALLALKIAEGVNAAIRGLWRMVSVVPLRVFSIQRRMGNEWRVAFPVYGVAAVAVLVWLLRNDVSVMSLSLVLKAILAGLLLPGFLLLLWSLLLALPALLITVIGFVGLGLLRWLAFGWAGSFDVEMTAETCPVGTATITRLGPRRGSRGLRHGYSYNDRRAPIVIGRFICRTLGRDRQVRGAVPTTVAVDPG